MATPATKKAATKKSVAKKAVPAKKAAVIKARQPRRTREQGMELLLGAAFTLIRKKNPDDISIREIASLAKVHHRFIAEWFGSKAQLLLVVHSRNSENIREFAVDVGNMRSQEVILEINQQLQLSLWLMRNGITFPDIYEAFPALAAAVKNLEINRGINPVEAQKIGSIYGAILLSNVIVTPFIESATTTVELFDFFTELLPPVKPKKK
jgi:AcrR family transcriptional regulator